MGTLLRPKFDFTSADGIVKAYTKAFGESVELASFRADLQELEQIRNLIVHRGGIVDDKFLSRTGIKERRGSAFTVNLPRVALYVQVITLATTALLNLVDGHLSAENRCSD